MFTRLLIMVIAYLLGSVPSGYLLSRLLTGKDIRDTGSGSIGATNVVRALGFKMGALTFFLDFLKGYFAVWLASGLMKNQVDLALACILVVVGHCYPIFLRFKGGKGVATAAGVVSYFSIALLGALLVLFFVVFYLTKTVSIASTVVVVAGLIAFYFMPLSSPIHLAILIISLLIVFQHRANFIRLIRGEELSFK